MSSVKQFTQDFDLTVTPGNVDEKKGDDDDEDLKNQVNMTQDSDEAPEKLSIDPSKMSIDEMLEASRRYM